jgi:hypothetical protein
MLMTSASTLLWQLRLRGIQFLAQGDRLRFRPGEWLTAQDRQLLLLHKPTLLRILHREQSILIPEDDYNERCWAGILNDDYQYLTGPRSLPERCAWCGGLNCHSQACHDLYDMWGVLPFGQYKGRRPSEVPVDYLRWVLASGRRIPLVVRRAIEQQVLRAYLRQE